MDKYGDLQIGKIESFKGELYVKLEDRPKFFKSHSVPYAIQVPTEEELDCLEHEEIVTHSEWGNQ